MKVPSSCLTLAIAVGISLGSGCATDKSQSAQSDDEVDIQLAQVPEPARTAIRKAVNGGRIEKLTRETERGKKVYDVEANVDGKHMEYLIAEADGALLGTEVPIDFAQLPEPVRTAAEKYFGTTTGLTAFKGVEYGETTYEIEGKKNGRRAELTLDPSGRPEK